MSWEDFGPSVTVPAALQALNSNSQLTLLLVGNPDAITPLLAKADFEQRSRLQIFLRSQLSPVMPGLRKLSAPVVEFNARGPGAGERRSSASLCQCR
ncbi:hypothetical protein ACVV4F_10530 [Escherichia coli]